MTTISELPHLDGVELQVLRSRLQAVADEGAIAIERTAISPVIAECRDYSCTILDADGALMVAGGAVTHHFGVCGPAVRVTLETHGSSITDGDVFFSNDPFNGGGLHSQDVLVQVPVFVDGAVVAWVVNSGHLMDMGGMVFGSWTPEATDCFQESLRMPPVRLFRAGEEQRDVWQILRTNVRVPDLVEMDLRSLVAGCMVAKNKLAEIARDRGPAWFETGVAQLRDLARVQMRRRIGQLADGTYRTSAWAEWGEDLYELPCEVTVTGEELLVDFTGAPAQTQHYFNTTPHIVAAGVVGDISDILVSELPLNEGMFDPVTLVCPPGSVVDSAPPAPIASAHCDVAMNASSAATECVMLAIAASPESEARPFQTGPIAHTAMGIQTWAYTTPDGMPDGWMMLDGAMGGASGSHDRDGTDLWTFMVTRKPIMEAIDVEMLELLYPVIADFKRIRRGRFGAGAYRGGGGCHMQIRPHRTPVIQGQFIGIRERMPINGAAGGSPGAVNHMVKHCADGSQEVLPAKCSDVVVTDDEAIEFAIASGGGYGDPLSRDPEAVVADLVTGRVSVDDAEAVYGVAVSDGGLDLDATLALRETLLGRRLTEAAPAARPQSSPARASDLDEPALPLYAGVEQRGATAVATESGAVLAHAPDLWLDGCLVLDEEIVPGIVERSYLDPVDGRRLYAEAIPPSRGATFSSLPRRWTRLADG
ncbi:hydantoinase B/oxoprolinase family protein [Mumia qirimensis]|uniref:hydantoinase B/oxoprolinase family protein n=1 Tax=Mumia qirimensis TaxID=3234852 RepID=UPI00351D2834